MSLPDPTRILRASDIVDHEVRIQDLEKRVEALEILLSRANKSRRGEFDRFWDVYPKKQKKGDARKAWLAVAKKLPPIDELIETVEAYKRICRDPQFVRLPATWLRSESWLDEMTIDVGPGSTHPELMLDPYPDPEAEAAAKERTAAMDAKNKDWESKK